MVMMYVSFDVCEIATIIINIDGMTIVLHNASYVHETLLSLRSPREMWKWRRKVSHSSWHHPFIGTPTSNKLPYTYLNL